MKHSFADQKGQIVYGELKNKDRERYDEQLYYNIHREAFRADET